MQKTSKVTCDNSKCPEIQLGTLLIDKNEDVWIIYSEYHLGSYRTYFYALCISASYGGICLYTSSDANINSDRVYSMLSKHGFEVLIGSVTITQK